MAQRKRKWQVKRQLIPKQIGWQRWDRSYQFLLEIAQAKRPTTVAPSIQGGSHESG